MLERGRGRIVITTSAAAYLPGGDLTAYPPSKAAVCRSGEIVTTIRCPRIRPPVCVGSSIYLIGDSNRLDTHWALSKVLTMREWLASADVSSSRWVRTLPHPRAVDQCLVALFRAPDHSDAWLAVSLAGAAIDRRRRPDGLTPEHGSPCLSCHLAPSSARCLASVHVLRDCRRSLPPHLR